MKTLYFLLLMAAFCLPAGGQDRIKIGYFRLEPFTIEQGGAAAPTGASVDYWEKLIAPAMGVTVEWVGPLPIARMYYFLDLGEIDAVFIVVKNPDREKKYLFPARPYCTGHASLWVLKDNPLVTLKDAGQLAGWRIGFVEGSVVNPFLERDDVTLENVQGEDYKLLNFSKLFAGRLEAIYDHNEYTLAYEAVRLGFRDKLRVVFLPLAPTPYYAAFAKTARGARFLTLYNNANGTLAAGAVEGIIRTYTEK